MASGVGWLHIPPEVLSTIYRWSLLPLHIPMAKAQRSYGDGPITQPRYFSQPTWPLSSATSGIEFSLDGA